MLLVCDMALNTLNRDLLATSTASNGSNDGTGPSTFETRLRSVVKEEGVAKGRAGTLTAKHFEPSENSPFP